MPSHNVLLGSGIPVESIPSTHIESPHERTPVWRFHKDFPDRLCKTDEELDKLDAEGWVDKPGKARLLPGHEKVWEAYQKSLEVSKTKEIKEEPKVEPIKTEDQIRADVLKAESDRVEAKRLADYEASKNPPGPRLCTLCGKEFDSIRALNMHGIAAHKNIK